MQQFLPTLALLAGIAVGQTAMPTVTAAPGTLPLGAPCSSSDQCANGADCYATNSMLIPACGNFQATCTSDLQCAFNLCKDGFCSGDLKPSDTSSSYGSLPSSTATSTGSSSSSTAAPGTVPVGSTCSTSADCAGGADCYASNSMLQLICGNFNAVCQSDAQCAFNLCKDGFCNGAVKSSAAASTTTQSGSMGSDGNGTTITSMTGSYASGTGATGTSSGGTTKTSTPVKAGAPGGIALGMKSMVGAMVLVWVL